MHKTLIPQLSITFLPQISPSKIEDQSIQFNPMEEGEEGVSYPLENEQTQKNKSKERGIWGIIMSAINWVIMLCDELHWSFVMGVIAVYGISQGLSMGLSRVTMQYYMKDEQKIQPSEAQISMGVIRFPWVVKPLWGLLTDVVPLSGYRRRPYFIFAGFLGVTSMLVLSIVDGLHLVPAVLSLMAGSAGVAIADVTIDACITENSSTHPTLASDMQSLSGLSSSIGALAGFIISGFLVHLVGSKGVFGLLTLPPALVVLVGLTIKDAPVRNHSYSRVNEKFGDAVRAMWTTLKSQHVWKPCLYMFSSLALNINIHEGLFYWYTDGKGGPLFSKEIVGSIYSIGALGSLCGVLLYQNMLKNRPYHDLLFWTQLLHCASGMLDLILVLRLNLNLYIPDYLFIVIDEGVSHMIGRLKWMPLLVLSSKLCPSGIEGTFFALLMSIDQVGMLTSTWAGGFVLHYLHVTRSEFENLWLAVLLRNLLRLTPIFLLFLVPRTDPNLPVLPSEISKTKRDTEMLTTDNLEMASLLDTS
ncbi:probable folate-biopterin transporter 3 isoform X1 [Chenopodium quinoa]|uniref:probable folate-biopterin transporter 3 isoform X1 n=1 Tax=Chenopodium quinoa TaxID=63459 RepID=UPI000B76D12E|nr:probable folate-biopterin transporter 3 isoform X1 [Chenopodium quinoa]